MCIGMVLDFALHPTSVFPHFSGRMEFLGAAFAKLGVAAMSVQQRLAAGREEFGRLAFGHVMAQLS